jgi:hypothetical protein
MAHESGVSREYIGEIERGNPALPAMKNPLSQASDRKPVGLEPGVVR